MQTDLYLSFPARDRVRVTSSGGSSEALPFSSPISAKHLRDLAWYVEVYGAHSLGDPDDAEAARIRDLLPVWGARLFDAVFGHPTARFLWERFLRGGSRLLTVASDDAFVHALPWELLHAPGGGGFLFMGSPRISIRRAMVRRPSAAASSPPFAPTAGLTLLFVVCRPREADFLDPRSDPEAIMEAIEEQAPGRIRCEFLRPPTLASLTERLADARRPPIQVVHFDGHGAFDREGNLAPGGLPNTGYLLFETEGGGPDPVSADRFASSLRQHRLELVILSACQSAMVQEGEGEEADDRRPQPAMGSVAAQLTASGVAAVLAMTHSILVATTRALFGAFYRSLAQGTRVGEALDEARQHLWNHPEKYEVQRGTDRVPLRLHDWFLPALYQAGDDVQLLTAAPPAPFPAPLPRSANLPAPPGAGFFGRRWELWRIERWFAEGVRRITVSGFGGQGKTALALEAGRWLVRTGMFEVCVFVDYARLQTLDAVSVAVERVGTVLAGRGDDAGVATSLLRGTPTLVILDNLEALPTEALRELLAAAEVWSEAGQSRVLCTTRRPGFDDLESPAAWAFGQNRLTLQALGSLEDPSDALEWFAALAKLPPPPSLPPPGRPELVDLFDKVGFHPLSIRILAHQLKSREARVLGRRLEELIGSEMVESSGEDAPPGLLASLRLSLDLLDSAARELLPRLGVFHGGAFESHLLDVTEIPHQEWLPLRHQLEAAALLGLETVRSTGEPYLRFHPTLAPMLWAGLPEEERRRGAASHLRRYSELVEALYFEIPIHPDWARAVVRRELPNILAAVNVAIEERDPGAVSFVTSLCTFLDLFGLRKEAASLLARVDDLASEVGSEALFQAQLSLGTQRLAEQDIAGAEAIFWGLLNQLGNDPTYERALILAKLARCHLAAGNPNLAIDRDRAALTVLESLQQKEENAGYRRLEGTCWTDLGDALAEQGRWGEARATYGRSWEIALEQDDLHAQGVLMAQAGALDLAEGKLQDAQRRYELALSLYQELAEPGGEAICLHQLGRVFQEAELWEEAEGHFREAARLREEIGDRAGAATSWQQLGHLSARAERVEAAERWYRKALGVYATEDAPLDRSNLLHNLAHVVCDRPDRLAEARELAEHALELKRWADPGSAQIWETYFLLALILNRLAGVPVGPWPWKWQAAEARPLRHLGRESKWSFPGTRHELRAHGELIASMVGACSGDASAAALVAQHQQSMREVGGPWGTAFSEVLDRLLRGERDRAALWDELDLNSSMIVAAILQGIADPGSLRDVVSGEGVAE
jgi:tetratricopeptide (TPR) repeat protein